MTTVHTIYKTTNLINGKIYVGKHSTKDPYDDYIGSGILISAAIKKYGVDNFKKEVLHTFSCEELAYLAEAMIVDEDFVKDPNVYNLRPGGMGASPGRGNHMWGRKGSLSPRYGKKSTEGHKRRISKALSGVPKSIPHRKKLSDALKGSTMPVEVREKISKAMTGEGNPFYGKTHSEETRKAISKSRIGRFSGKNSPSYGVPKTKEHREKLSIANTGKKLSKEHRMKISKGGIGRIHSDATREKMSKAAMGRKQEIVTCDVCGKSGGVSNMKRWHFDNCRFG